MGIDSFRPARIPIRPHSASTAEIGRARDAAPAAAPGIADIDLSAALRTVSRTPVARAASATTTPIGIRARLLSGDTTLDSASKERWIERVSADGMALADAPASLRNDPDVVRAAVLQTSDAIRFASDVLRRDREFLLSIAETAPAVLRKGIASELVADTEFLMEAVRRSTMAVWTVYFLRPELFRDRESFLAIVDLNSHAWNVLRTKEPELARQPGLLEEALRRNPNVVVELSEGELADPANVAAAIRAGALKGLYRFSDDAIAEALRDPDLVNTVSQAITSGALTGRPPTAMLRHPVLLGAALAQDMRLFDDEDVARFLAEINDPRDLRQLLSAMPLAYPNLPETVRAVVDRQLPDIADQAKSLVAEIADRKLDSLLRRVTKLSTVREILRVRASLDEPDGRPLAVLMYPTSDWNGAFRHNELDELTKGYRVAYFEVGTDAEWIRSLLSATKGQKADLLVIAGHGTKSSTQLGSAILPHWLRESRFLDRGDWRQLASAGIGQCLAPGSNVVIESCSTGKGGEDARNMAALWHRVFPQARIFAPTVPSASTLELDEEGRFAGVRFSEGEANRIIIEPT